MYGENSQRLHSPSQGDTTCLWDKKQEKALALGECLLRFVFACGDVFSVQLAARRHLAGEWSAGAV